MPAAAWPATRSKCGVWPRITQPMQTIAAKRRVRARCNAACGSSKAPGTQCTSTSTAAAPAACSDWSAPSSRRLVIGSLKRAATTANFAPERDRARERDDGARPAISVGQRGQEVAELVALGAQILPILGIRGNLDGQALDDGEAIALDAGALRRIVRQQAHVLQTEVHEDLGADAVVAEIRLEAQRGVGFDGIHTDVLQPVGADFVVQADPPPLLPQIDHDPASFLLDHRHGHVQLWPTVAAQRMEDVAGEAL